VDDKKEQDGRTRRADEAGGDVGRRTIELVGALQTHEVQPHLEAEADVHGKEYEERHLEDANDNGVSHRGRVPSIRSGVRTQQEQIAGKMLDHEQQEQHAGDRFGVLATDGLAPDREWPDHGCKVAIEDVSVREAVTRVPYRAA
jgi:hypothetical protein